MLQLHGQVEGYRHPATVDFFLNEAALQDGQTYVGHHGAHNY